MSSITITYEAPRRATFPLPLYTRDRTNTIYCAVLSDDLTLIVTSDGIEAITTAKTALRTGFVQIDEFDFMERYNATQERLKTIIETIADMKKPDNEIIESNGQIKHF